LDRTGIHNGGKLAEKLKSGYRTRGLGAVSSSRTDRSNSGRTSFEREDGIKANCSFRRRSDIREEHRKEEAREIAVEKKKIPLGFLIGLAFCTLMIMLIVLSMARIYQTKREITRLEQDITSMMAVIDGLELELDEKNDIRLIEQMATSSLGMVKEDSVRRKYISLSDGERVELIEADDAPAEEGMGTMLSSFFSSFGDFFEYFK